MMSGDHLASGIMAWRTSINTNLLGSEDKTLSVALDSSSLGPSLSMSNSLGRSFAIEYNRIFRSDI
jgi:hypothetical protein